MQVTGAKLNLFKLELFFQLKNQVNQNYQLISMFANYKLKRTK